MYFVATGARVGEATRARREDVDFDRRLVHLRGTKTEAADDDIPITKVNEEALRWSLASAPGKEGLLFRPWGKLHRDLAAACERAGIAKVTPNDLRRAFAKYHRLAGVDVTTVSMMLRHTTDMLAQTTYAKVSGNEVGDLANVQILSVPTFTLPVHTSSDTVPILYRAKVELSIDEQQLLVDLSEKQAPPARVELATNALGKHCSIH
jgi:integrase